MMKIVFDIQCPQMVSGGGQAYTREPGRQGFKSARVNLAILAGDAQNHPELPRWMFDDDPGIYIEGDYEYVHRALVDALHALELSEKHWRERLGEDRPTNCPDQCQTITENGNHRIDCPRHPNFEYFQGRAAEESGAPSRRAWEEVAMSEAQITPELPRWRWEVRAVKITHVVRFEGGSFGSPACADSEV